MSSTTSELGIFKDFEIIWVDRITQLPKDMDDVTLEIYHYEDAQPGEIVVTVQEPYIVTETVNDRVSIGSLCPASGYIVDVDFTLELSLVGTQLEGLGCYPNNYVVPGTTEKIANVGGYTKYALSACELSALINLEASGYTASNEDGFLVLRGDIKGSDCYLQVGDGTFNCVVSLTEGDQYYGSSVDKVFDLSPKDMTRASTGTYVCLGEELKTPPYEIGERYFALYRGKDVLTSQEEISQEDFTIIKNLNDKGISFSFLK